MNQILKIPSNGVCYYFSFRHRDKSYICSRCFGFKKGFTMNYLDYSTYESPLLKYSVKNKKKDGPCVRRLKETELLKVTNKQATQKTMTVGTLNASVVTAFAKEPGMILNNTKNSKFKGETYQKKEFIRSKNVVKENQSYSDVKTSNSFNDVKKSVLTSKKSSDTNDDRKNFVTDSHRSQICDFYGSAMLSNEPSYNVDDNFSSRSQNSEFNVSQKKYQVHSKSGEMLVDQPFPESVEDVLTKSSRSDCFSFFQVQNSIFEDTEINDPLVISAIDVCVNNEMLETAFALLRNHRMKSTQNNDMYNLVIKGYSEIGDWGNVNKILRLMEDRSIQPNLLTYALSLDCLYRSSLNNHLKKKKAQTMLTIFRSMGYMLNDLFRVTRLNHCQRENILKVVHWIFPQFRPSPPSFSCEESIHLVADLYDKDYVKTSPLPLFNCNAMDDAIQEQLTLETKLFCEVESVVKRGICFIEYKEKWAKLIDIWKNNLTINFRQYINALKEEVKGNNYVPNIYPFLNCLPMEDFINLMLHEINYLCLTSEGYSLNTSIIYNGLGNRVWHRYCVRKKIKNKELMEKYTKFIKMYSSWYLKPDSEASARRKWLNMMWDNPDITSMGDRNISWPDEVKAKIGKFIFDIILKSTLVPSELLPSKSDKINFPAFYQVLRYNKGHLSEQLKFHPSVGVLYRRANINTLFFDVDQMPMFCPPKPWTSVDSGGFYILPTSFLRPTQFNYNMRILRSVPSTNLHAIFDSLNQLQSVPWTVNESVLDVALKVFREGGSRELNVPVYPDLSPIPQPTENLDASIRAAAYKERLKIIQERQDDFGLWCEGLYKLSIANHFRGKVFWLPHNMDFRGRVYPVPPHISHITSDLYRSLFLFAKKERLGEKGLDWLKIHAINLIGTFSKKPVSERLKHANELLDDIVDSAENPLNGKRWWTKSEEPWQTLAACIEIRNALVSGKPEDYETGFPVHQDGSCNGLQHYAALGRDCIGAASVNLKPSDEPQDVYSVVAGIVEQMRDRDAKEGIKIAMVLEGFVTRKVVKQTVMTTVYGVTRYGARLQISNRLQEETNFPSNRISEASIYLTGKVFEALEEMFTSAKEIQDWFIKCASIITGSYKSTVSWITPLGLPVAQPYFKNKSFLRTNLKNLLPDKRKQKNAFAPNFIHSLDSSHMMLTALYCGKLGLCFASVHDCYWTHPSKVDIMNRICREKFIALHSEEILDDLCEYFLKTYTNPQSTVIDGQLMNVPKRGNFDLTSVLDSVYFFS